MSRTRIAATAIGLAGALAASQAQGQSASSSDQEIALLKQQLKMLEQKLDRLQSQTAANTAATAKAKIEQLTESGQFSPRRIVTKVEPAQTFWRAEEYHQKYLEKRGQASCHI